MKQSLATHLRRGIIDENPTFIQVLGTCPTLAITTTAFNSLGMGLSVTFVLMCSNVLISLLRKVIPERIRIPAYIVIIASFVTVIDLLLQAFFYDSLYQSLGVFIPLIVVNCIILGRAEAYAGKNGVLDSFFDGLSNGIGFTCAIFVIGTIREILGSGTFFGFKVTGSSFEPVAIFALAPGGFFVFGIAMGIFRTIMFKRKQKARKEELRYISASVSKKLEDDTWEIGFTED